MNCQNQRGAPFPHQFNRTVIRVCVVPSFGLATATGVNAAAAAATWMEPAVVQAAYDIGMDERQRALFRSSLQEFLTKRAETISRVSRSNNPDPERRIKRSINQLVATMDTQMREIRSSEQQPRWEIYQQLLMTKSGI